jgi:hypothetical protein
VADLSRAQPLSVVPRGPHRADRCIIVAEAGAVMGGPALGLELSESELRSLLVSCDLEIMPAAAELLSAMPVGGSVENIAALVACGRLTLLELPEEMPRFGAGGEPREESEEPAAAVATEKAWIKFRVVDDETGEPVAGVTLRIREPGGLERDYTTRADGGIEINEIDPGACDILEMTDPDALEVVRTE